jgi:hypothetical protein
MPSGLAASGGVLSSASDDDAGGNPANIAASRASNPIQRDARAAEKPTARVGKSRAAGQRRSERRCFSSASDDDACGFAMFAPPICRRRWRNTLSVPPSPTTPAATQRPSQRAERAIQYSAIARAVENPAASVGKSRAAVLRTTETRCSFLGDGGRSRRVPSAMREQLRMGAWVSVNCSFPFWATGQVSSSRSHPPGVQPLPRER